MYIGNEKKIAFLFDESDSDLVWLLTEVLLHALKHNCALKEVPFYEEHAAKLDNVLVEHDFLGTIERTMPGDNQKDVRVRSCSRHIEIVVSESFPWEMVLISSPG